MQSTQKSDAPKNPVGILGFEFVEFAATEPTALHRLFQDLGFSRLKKSEDRSVDYYKQGDIHFLLNTDPQSFAQSFAKLHGPSVSSTGWRVENAQKSFEIAISRGAKAAPKTDYMRHGMKVPALVGVGDSVIYLIDDHKNPNRYAELGFVDLTIPDKVASKGFALMDHLTNNVFQGELKPLSDFYVNVFGFEEIRYFDIRGEKTGLKSFALRSPCGSF